MGTVWSELRDLLSSFLSVRPHLMVFLREWMQTRGCSSGVIGSPEVWNFSRTITSDRRRHHMTEIPHDDTWSSSICWWRPWNVVKGQEDADVIWSWRLGHFDVKNFLYCVGGFAVALTWSHRAICRSFQREVPDVRSIFMLPRISTLLALCVLQLASCKHTGQHTLKQASSIVNILVYTCMQCFIQTHRSLFEKKVFWDCRC